MSNTARNADEFSLVSRSGRIQCGVIRDTPRSPRWIITYQYLTKDRNADIADMSYGTSLQLCTVPAGTITCER